MSEEVKLQESVKKTQELLGKYIKKPPLTDKLLKKPPFRFLHDIINAIIKETGFLKNLFTDEESNSSNIKDKEAKLLYLNKLIDAVKLITGNELSVRPSKIISGQEPIKTNEFLQAIGRALDKKVSSTEAIEYYKKNLEKKEGLKSKSTKVNSSPDEKIKKPVKKSSPSESKPSSREKTRDKDDKTKRDSKSLSKETKIRDRSIDKRESKTRETKKKEIIPGETSSKKRKNLESTEKHVKVDEKKPIKSTVSSNDVKNFEVKKESVDISDELINDHKENVNQVPDDSPHSTQENQEEIIAEKVNEEPKEVMLSPTELEVKVEKPEEKLITDIIVTKTTVGLLRPPSARPPSARPAAPKVRGKPDFIMNNGGINQMGEVNVIVENFDTKDDEDDDADDMVVMETSANNDSLSLGGTTDLLSTQLTQEHGYLVAQILDTQRELVNESNVELIPNKVEIEWEAGLKKDRDMVVKEIDKLRGTIQSLTRTTNPLGKLLDFLQEDAEIMEKELQDWRIQFNNVREQLIIERNMTSESLKPLEESLKDVESSIVNQMEKIFQTKANIMKNNQKIHRLLSGK
ncbi:hypothetical protein PV327_008982 [Microctonus hyperodae]|uniref:TRAF3-interacting protein 1 n=1 Tax=Microctonus hyperodae TaxID=165561 RepID=A0AA39FTF9_MICHY|nr:hypothetical protein PV327_008982 [Microctonus hyperodae]